MYGQVHINKKIKILSFLLDDDNEVATGPGKYMFPNINANNIMRIDILFRGYC